MNQLPPPWTLHEPKPAVEEPPVLEAQLVQALEEDEIPEPEPLPPRQSGKDEFGLNPKQRLFADEWLTGEHTGRRFHGPSAYEYAGYIVNEQNRYTDPSRLLRHPKVSEYIKKRMTELTMTAEEVLMRLTELARADYSSTIRLDANGKLEQDPQGVMQHAKFVKSFTRDSNGYPKIEFHDPVGALRDMIKVLGMAKEGLEIGGMGGGPVRMELVFVGPNQEKEPYLPPGAEELPPAESFDDLDALG